jgi:HlyD family secretion protein
MGAKKIADIQSQRAEEVQEILSRPPGYLIGWGSSSILIILGLFVVLGFFIEFPETIVGEANLTTSVDPALIYNTNDGYLNKIYSEENSFVEKGQVIAEIRSTSSLDNIEFLDELIYFLRQKIKENVSTIKLPTSNLSFGPLQENYNTLVKQVHEFNELNSIYHKKSVAQLKEKIETLESLSKIFATKLEIGKNELVNAKMQFEIDKGLYNEHVIAKSEWIQKNSLYNQKLTEFENLKQSFFQNDLQLKEMKGNQQDLNYEIERNLSQKLKQIELSLTSMENYRQEWKNKYTIVAPIEGKINFIRKTSPGDYVRSNVPLAFIVPENQDIRAKVKVNFKGYGKIIPGQSARITLDTYPYQEYGYFMGKVISISEAPSEDYYEAIVDLPDNLVSSFDHKIQYKPNSVGKAEIITADYSVLERLIFSTRSSLSNLSK